MVAVNSTEGYAFNCFLPSGKNNVLLWSNKGFVILLTPGGSVLISSRLIIIPGVLIASTTLESTWYVPRVGSNLKAYVMSSSSVCILHAKFDNSLLEKCASIS